MSGFHEGSFGRMLPANDSSAPETTPERPANKSEPGDDPYKLPPPRAPANSQFGTDALLRQRQDESAESGKDSTSLEPSPQPQRNEQLPSLRHLLTPNADPNSPPTYHPPFADPAAGIDHREYSYPFRRHEQHNFPQLQFSPIPGQDRAKGRSESFPQPQISTLPPLSQMASHSPRDMKHHSATRSDPLASSFQHSQINYPRTLYHETSLGVGDASSPENANRTKGQSVLPHVIDERYVEGEGVCYVYADGTHVPKLIDGVPVNANWGVTKAGKPRKRLAQACLTCREKKIKCHPNLPKCDQCQKSGRECRFESAPRGTRSSLRGSHSTGPLSNYDMREGLSPGPHVPSDTSPSLYNMPQASASATSLPGTSGHSPGSEEQPTTSAIADNRFDSMLDTDRAYGSSHMYRDPRSASSGEDTATRLADLENPRPEYSDIFGEIGETSADDPLAGSWSLDPYEYDAEVTTHYLESYLTYVNDGLYHIFPHTRFALWVKSCHTKSAEDRMLLYAMMALGAIFSDRPDKIGALKRYSRVARFAILKSQHTLTLQLAQSHLIMSLLYYATGSLVGFWDSIGAAGRAVSGLRYNVESGGVIVDQNQACDYGLHPQALIECRRRTYWVAFILDRVSSFFSASSTFIPPESALIRLPCREEIYEAQQYATAPYFQPFLNQNSGADDDRSSLSSMAFLIQIMALWGDVSLNVFRLAHTPSDTYARLAEEFHSIITVRTEEWMKRLPEELTFSVINLERAIFTKKADTFISIHMLYHATLMKVYRYARYSNLRSDILVQYIHRARYHAVGTLRAIMGSMPYLDIVQTSRFSNDIPGINGTLLSPLLGYLILSAVDVLSAAGLIEELPDCVPLLKGALRVVKVLGRHWDSSVSLANLMQRRLDILTDCMNDRVRTQDKTGFILVGSSLESKVHASSSASHPPGALEEDLFFGSMPKEMLLNGMRVDDIAIAEQRIIWLKDV
ncbi:uncharacterized protein N7483_000973 [Penicillium malachiteum]|uniref:uncharacterized protein n=1 Tax=Penicillium malachiteum TaxID=1324776 RepID=UPI002549BDDA|nr:uncharacterized protein N7483_000973 [Penicillium malachiteum]KAJ5735848.1 hypothetical protein N7483_000973 [Penicillium malachiteum]